VNRPHAAGAHTARWNGTDDHGRRVGSGVYFYEIQSSGFRASKKLILLK
jgi:flagellar hook assembly protein FlgD